MRATFPAGQRVFSRSSITNEVREYFVPPTIRHLDAPPIVEEQGSTFPDDRFFLPMAAIVASRGRTVLSLDVLRQARSIKRLTDSWSHRSIDAETLLDLHAETNFRHGARSVYRDTMVWVDGLRPVDAKLIPAPASSLPFLLDDFFGFVRRNDVLPIVKLAVAHYQFLAIHPFFDGNGRLSRVLALLIARRSNGIGIAFALATGLSLHRRALARLFSQVRCGNLENYIEYWKRLLAWSGPCVQRLYELRDACRKRIVAQLDGLNLSDRTPAFLLDNPLFHSSDLTNSLSLSAKLALRYQATMLNPGLIAPLTIENADSFCCPIAVDYWHQAQKFVASTAVDVLPP